MTDLTPMPFGKYANVPMQDVPVGYLHWFYHNGKFNNSKAKEVKDYIFENLSALKMENEDLIWKI